MGPVRQIREILKGWREKAEVLPAADGALEDELHLDAEEHGERSYTDDRVFDAIFERSSGEQSARPA